MLSLSILVVADLTGLIANPQDSTRNTRAALAESLAIQLSATPTREALPIVRHTLFQFVQRSTEVVGAGMSRSDGGPLLWFGVEWDETMGDQMPSLEFFEVPLYRNDQLWGTLYVRFQPTAEGWLRKFVHSRWALLVLFPLVCAAFFYLFLRRALRELDPPIVPDGMEAALDALSQGLMVIDAREHIVLANEALVQRLGLGQTGLVGQRVDSVDWHVVDPHKDPPWKRALDHGETVSNIALRFNRERDSNVDFMVTGVPITTPAGKVNGAIVMFDDLTSVHKRNRELHAALTELRRSQDEISDKNKRLEFLDTHDPLTGCLNRRAFTEELDAAFAIARRDERPLSCVVIDIDHFKVINEEHGHTVGDRVIGLVADILKSNSRAGDRVGRHGGEEFCILIPNADLEHALAYAERVRRAINTATPRSDAASAPLMPVTASLGVACLTPDVAGTAQLLDLADRAVQCAKRFGRNQVRTPDGRAFDAQFVGDVQALEPADEGGLVSDLRRRLHEMEGLLNARTNEIWEHSLHDTLTGLPNRVLLMDRINQLIKRCDRTKTSAGVVSVQICDVHRINQTLGHGAGDELLTSVARRLVDVTRGIDTLSRDAGNAHTASRVGGNDFAILISDLTDPGVSSRILTRIQKALSAPFTVSGEEVIVAGKLGVSLYPHDASDAETLLQTAAVARASLAPDRLGIAVAYYSDDLNHALTRRLKIETLLLKALDDDEFTIDFQPKISIASGHITGVEALARWTCETLGQISPAEFIPIAEQTGLSGRLTETVLTQVSRELRKWRQLHIDDVRIAINLSSTEFQDLNYAEWLLDTITRLDIDPGHLEIEVTERSFVDDYENGLHILTTLKNNGLSVAMDDFGTGYSSLSQLKDLPFDSIKIDACFVREIHLHDENRAIVKAVIGMARDLGMNVIAEGVETEAEYDALADLGCPEVQGFLTCRPLPGNEITEFLLSRAHTARKTPQLRSVTNVQRPPSQ